MRHLTKTIFYLCAFALFGLLTGKPIILPSPVYSQTSTGPAPIACSALDVVFLIDQSDSMSGFGGAAATDPTDQRKYAPQGVIDILADIVSNQCPDIIHRIAVISYGTYATLDLPLSNIAHDNAQDIRDDLKDAIAAQQLGETNPKEAFELANQILDNAAPIGEGIRKRVIIFITDGVPCIRDLGCGTTGTFDFIGYAEEMRDQIAEELPFNDSLLQREACISTLRDEVGPDNPLPGEEVNNCLDQYRVSDDGYQDSTYIWMILLRANQAYPADLHQIYVDIAESHAGEVVDLSVNRQEIPATFRNILEQLTGVRAVRLDCGPFAVNPYVKQAKFIFYKYDDSVEVVISYTDVDGVRHEISRGIGDAGFMISGEDGYKSGGGHEEYTLDKPYPGIWNLSSENCDQIEGYYDPVNITLGLEQLSITAELPQRDRPPYYDTESPQFLAIQMRDQSDRVVEQADHPIFAIDVQLTVTDPTGQEAEYVMTWIEAEQLFRATEPLRTPITGSYQIRVTGTTFKTEVDEPTLVVSNNYSEVFNTPDELFDESFEFTVFPISPFVIEIVSPTPGEVLMPVHGSADVGNQPFLLPIPVRVGIVDRQGQALPDLDAVFANPDAVLSATVIAGADSGSIVLTRDPVLPNEYIGEIPGLNVTGDYQLVVNLNSEFAGDYYPDNRSARVSFIRLDETWRFELVNPMEGESLRPVHGTIRDGWPLPIRPLPIRAQLVNETGQPYSNIEAIIPYAPGVLTATVMSGDVTVRTTLLPNPNAPGQYVGQIEDLGERGEYQLEVALELDYPNYFTPQSVPARITFFRLDGLWNRVSTYYVVLISIILFIIANIIRYFAIRTNPITGMLSFQDSGIPIATYGLASGKNWAVIKSRMLRPYPQLELKKIVVENNAKRKRPRLQSDIDPALIDPSLDSSVDQGVSVHLTPIRGSTSHINLPPSTPTSYGDSIFQIIYEPPDSSGQNF